MSLPFMTTTRRKGIAALGAAVALTALGLNFLPELQSADAVAKHPRNESREPALQESLNDFVRDGSVPGALASVRDRDGRTTNLTAGVGDIRTKAKVPTDGYIRIASNTKMFTAVAILQLAGEGKLRLDDSVDKYLPGVIRGKGFDARKITIRNLLQHTSGIQTDTFLGQGGIVPIRNTYFEPRDLVDSALAQGAKSKPGKEFSYSNTGYVILGLVAQKVTGRPFAEVITKRIVDRIGLKRTYYPGPGDRAIRDPHPHGYLLDEKGALVDITEFDPSIAGAAGQIISTPSDLNQFLVALHTGKLLKPGELTEMRKTVPATGMPNGWEYGLGQIKFKLSCGIVAWGHGGDADGFQSRTAITTDGRAVTVAATNDGVPMEKMMNFISIFDAALCAEK
jgi:D-alanyl-D-alanine carboxypeptidase